MRNELRCITLAALLVAGCDATRPLSPDGEGSAIVGSPALASRAAITEFTATDVTVALIAPGIATLKPADAPEQVVIRGLTALSRTEASDHRATGNTTVVANGVLSLIDGTGPVSGTFRTEVDGGGFWEGQWHGYRELTGPSEWTATLKVEGDGYGGEVEGMKIAYTNTVTTFELTPTASVGVIAGRLSGR